MKDEQHMIFTDGSSLGNPGPGGWGTVLVLGGTRVIEMGGYERDTTNNRMELTALIRGLERMKGESGAVTIYLDSTYVEKGSTSWVHGWKKRDWKTTQKTDVENRDLWEEVSSLLDDRNKHGDVKWKHVPGHAGVAGNERADAIATGYAKEDDVIIFEGDLADYAVDILNIGSDDDLLSKKNTSRSHARAKAYSYLSLVNGIAKRHLTWAECEKRVKGRAGVKYKKALSPADESAILRSWGVTL